MDVGAPLLVADSAWTETIAPGVVHRAYVVRRAPWAIHVLDVDRRQCATPIAVKGAPGAVGRRRTTELAAGVASRDTVVLGAVNADFFLFDPPGVLTGAHVSGGRVVTGPGVRPVFAVDSAGNIRLGVLTLSGLAVAGVDTMIIEGWNRSVAGGLSWFDPGYGTLVDTATGSVRLLLTARTRGQVVAIAAGDSATPIPPSGGVLVLGRDAPADTRQRFLRLARTGGRFDVSVHLQPLHPREAVGGFPILVRDSVEVPGLDSAGAATFAPVRHPRTIAAVASRGRRLILVTVDGRQPGHSVGMTLRESAMLALELGATDAINLDGGGSTAMVVARSSAVGTRYELVNHPSDAAGERPVGNALVVACIAGVRARGTGDAR